MAVVYAVVDLILDYIFESATSQLTTNIVIKARQIFNTLTVHNLRFNIYIDTDISIIAVQHDSAKRGRLEDMCIKGSKPDKI